MNIETVATPDINDHLPVFLFLFLCFFFLDSAGFSMAEAGQTAQGLINCSFDQGPCHLKLSGQDISFEISPKPVKAMSVLDFKMIFSENLAGEEAAFLMDLDMPGMNMGGNQVHMKKISKGVYEGRGTIVRCLSGGKIWRATAILPKQGKIQFIFEVH